ncbi:DNA-3-methyladenine glycosylase family protein [Ilumatobacter coccineus]|uniref:3-methyladenine DNA glycosylase n=1 Tax=Ilumatobacter coccineus (strain NBRC 103263 / KCTC 29153 / YM16-304) TaxID=1313172 RepID=A0A6C7E906_ILUCY|nr:hypothetical protein [Ilumatobacter coccineus]BAN02843.1 hypothetical protein YM304_25290 [Ilumatobacter coccineus YM16-304]
MAVLDRRSTSAATDARPVDVGATLAPYRRGASDPTTWIDCIGNGSAGAGRFTRATFTPDGPATVNIRWDGNGLLDAETWGPGADWLLARVPFMIGDGDEGAPDLESDEHPAVARAARSQRALRLGASGGFYHELLPTIIEQRITGLEAKRQWAALCHELSGPAPGPFARLLLPPAPDVLRRQPSWWFHPLGIERKRAQPLIEVARHASKLWEWAELDPREAERLLHLIPGVGVWTTGMTLGPVMGDPDAVPVGDYHVKNIIGFALANEARATDERMLQLLAPYAGQRGRVVRIVMADGNGAPKFGPRQRILPMARW